MSLPLTFDDLSLWLAAAAIILLVTYELLSPSYGRSSVYINRKKLRNAALTVSALFVMTLMVRLVTLVIYP